jgi:hypothetical protein
MKTYTFGEITLTQQALSVFIITTLSALSSLFILGKNPKLSVLMFFIMFGFGCYATYVTNCTVVGKCDKLAWFLVAANALSALLIIPARIKIML